jgi:hypothetical protein
MQRIVWTFGLIAGTILAGLLVAMVQMCMDENADLEKSEIVGYSGMVLAFVMVFVGIRSYRENAGGGTITFGKAFKVGIIITLIACAIYVVTWQIVYFNFVPDFGEKYAARVIKQMQEDGATGAAVVAKREELAKFAKLYKNPLFNAGITFLEVFPVGLVVTLISAAILRKRSAPGFAAA